MIDFSKVAKDSYVIYVNGARVTDTPLTYQEMCAKLGDLDLSESDVMFIENMYKGGDQT